VTRKRVDLSASWPSESAGGKPGPPVAETMAIFRHLACLAARKPFFFPEFSMLI
jgi:hypothetical protein